MMEDFFTLISNTKLDMFSIAIAVLFGFAAINTVSQLLIPIFTRGIKLSLRVAVIGLPRAGKTSLITVVFDAIMSGKLAKFATVRGGQTVDRVTRYMTAMSKGINLGPTDDKDVFAYRYGVSQRRFGLIPLKYDVEIADFPGEYSKDLSENLLDQQLPTGLYKKEFFSWVLQADRYIFVIDAETFLKSEASDRSAYVSMIDVLFKNAVLHLKNELLDEKVYNRRALVVFTKCDTAFCVPLAGESEEANLVYRDHRMDNVLTDEEKLTDAQNQLSQMVDQFSVTLDFLSNNFKRMDVLLHSSYFDLPFSEGANDRVVRFSSP
ncbi:hypothetical protein NBRC116594_12150 [Shimia sp. NS0008-38b]|uniref:TRAFAC clade GTPase domain-containing protein n=1 Tax=Shimia sp. NS0008-38b TaxID=3127653 RepID=UPI003105346E